ncbi:MAG TPA: NUDIX domain-containing protein [Steroidobacteraceae bacterium]|jgi:8-oxo-dGTP pyrophosphatase MutT (NUDIX family)|nr:NUDIX domain-containing protein [Steroidobacteraceae bacterium]
MAERILSAGVVVVRETDQGWRLLLLRAYNYWDFPKGQVEPGEDPLTTAKREVREESSIDDLEFRWGEAFTETDPYGRNKVARYYLAVSPAARVELAVNPALGRPEHQEFRWLDAASASKLVVPRVAAVIGWAQARLR